MSCRFLYSFPEDTFIQTTEMPLLKNKNDKNYNEINHLM